MKQEQDLQITNKLTQYAFQNVKGGQVKLKEFSAVLDMVDGVAGILNQTPEIDEMLARFGKKPFGAKRWEQTALNVLDSLIPANQEP